MTNLSNLLASDPTLDAINQDIEQTNLTKKRKPPYLGASSIGDPCERKIWLQWRMAKQERFTAEQLRRFEDGYHCESVEASRLSRVSGVTLKTVNPSTGYQYGLVAVDGHLRGRIDGMVIGLLQAPTTMHVWEAKACDEKKQTALLKAKQEHGEKNALKAWDALYYAQAILYMHFLDLDRHYLTCTTPGARWTISVRTNADKDEALRLLEKAERIKSSDNLPVGISTNPAWYQCKACAFNGLCHQNQVADVNCRTCLHATPVAEGEWHCAKFNGVIPGQFQMTGCDQHLFLPDLIPYAKAIDANPEDNWVEYQTKEGNTFKNGKAHYTSTELSSLQDYKALGDPVIDQLREQFDAVIVA